MNTVAFWTAPNLAYPFLKHGFTERNGGVSPAPYDSLNLGLHVGDKPENVIENRRQVAESLGFSLENMVCAQQIHQKTVASVTKAEVGRGVYTQETALPGTDALITNTPDILLALFFADCLPVFFVDAERPAIAIAHAGWRGLVSGVLEETVAALHHAFGSQPDRLQVAIGPGISLAYFEVGREVVDAFPASVIQYHPGTGKPHIDLPAAARLRLIAAGIRSENLSLATECTFTDSDRFFSHRRDNGRTGRMGGCIGLVHNR